VDKNHQPNGTRIAFCADTPDEVVPAILQEPRRHRYLKLIALFKIGKGALLLCWVFRSFS